MKNSKKLRYGIVASRFNGEITQKLVSGAMDFLQSKKIARNQVDVIWVSGAFELPQAALQMGLTQQYRLLVAVGCILEGETKHYAYLSQAALHGLMMAGLLTGVPVTSGVITASSWKQAQERAKQKGLNRGREAAQAAWQLIEVVG